MQIHVVFPSNILTPAYRIVQIFQLILGIYVLSQNWTIQIPKEVPADCLLFNVNILLKTPLSPSEGQIPRVIEGIKSERQFLKRWKIPPEKVGILAQQFAVFSVAGFEQLLIRLIKCLG